MKMNQHKKTAFVKILYFIIVLFLMFAAVRAGSQLIWHPQKADQELDEAVDDLLKSYQIQGGTIVFIHDKNIAEVRNYGYSDKENQIITTDQTAYKIASVSKAVTAYAIMQLVNEGILDLDTPISAYLTKWKIPESEYDSEKVTLRTLMSHTSGLSDSTEEDYEEPLPPIEKALKQRNIFLTREPGTRFEYSNFVGFGVCQLIIEEVTGKPFEEYMKQTVFQPLDMSGAGYYNASIPDYELAVPYTGKEQASEIIPIVMTGSAGISATGRDIACFVIRLIEFYQNENREMFQIQNNTESFNGGYGFGMVIHELSDGGMIYEHNGNLPGWNAQIAFEPQSGDGFVFLSNSDRASYLTSELLAVWSHSMDK